MNKKQSLHGNMMMLIVLAAAAVLVGVRVGCTFLFSEDNHADFTANVYIVIGLVIGLAGLWAAAFFVRPSSQKEPSVFPVAITTVLLGLALVIGNIFDAVMWLGFQQPPAPLEKLLNLTDTLMLTGSLLFGILAGIYLIRVALIWMAEERFYTGIFRTGALVPVLWLWLRIARYELAHAGMVAITFSVYNFFFFAFALWFLFRFAVVAADVGRKRLISLRFLAAATALCGLSDTVVRFTMYVIRDARTYQSAELVNGVDFCVALLALAMVWFLWNGGLDDSSPERPPVQEQEDGLPVPPAMPLILGDDVPLKRAVVPEKKADDEVGGELPEETIPETPSMSEAVPIADADRVAESRQPETPKPAKAETELSVDEILNDILAAREKK